MRHHAVGALNDGDHKVAIARNLERVADADIVGKHAQKACDKRLVGAVALVRAGKRVVADDVGTYDR